MSPASSLRHLSALAIAVLPCLTACDEPTPKTWPAETIFALDGTPLTAAEIDSGANIIAELEPDCAPTYARRISFTNIVLPRVAGILVAGPKREAARKKALEFKAALDSGATLSDTLDGGFMHDRSGVAHEIGLDAWSYASTAAFGTWSEPIETVGAFEIVRLDQRSNAESPRQVRYKLRVCVVPYLEVSTMRASIEERLDRATLVIVDPAWSEIVPEALKHRLHVGAP